MKNRCLVLILTLAAVIFTECKNFDSNQANDQLKPDDKTINQSTSVDSGNNLEESLTFQLLQGKWQHIEDKSDFLVFDKNHRKEIAGGMDKWDDEIFVLSDHCLNESGSDGSEPKEKDKYISCKGVCWYIESLDSDYLTLTYLGRGNELVYKRVKE